MLPQYFFKGFTRDGRRRRISGPYSGFDYTAFLPKVGELGPWLPSEKVVMCQSGYHVEPTLERARTWGDTVYVVEVRGKGKKKAGATKRVFSSIRLIAKVA